MIGQFLAVDIIFLPLAVVLLAAGDRNVVASIVDEAVGFRNVILDGVLSGFPVALSCEIP